MVHRNGFICEDTARYNEDLVEEGNNHSVSVSVEKRASASVTAVHKRIRARKSFDPDEGAMKKNHTTDKSIFSKTTHHYWRIKEKVNKLRYSIIFPHASFYPPSLIRLDTILQLVRKYPISSFLLMLYVSIDVLDVAFKSHGMPTSNTSSNSHSYLRSQSLVELNDPAVTAAENTIPFNSTGSSFAVVINTYKRPERLKESVYHYAQTCGKEYGVGEVYFVWAELDKDPPLASSFLHHEKGSVENDASVHAIKVLKDSLNSRFLPIEGLKKENPGVFMVDDDIIVTCSSLKTGFDAWRSSPLALVGYYPRLVTPQPDNKYEYLAWDSVYIENTFDIILTKASFFHSKYLELYSSDETHPHEIKDYVDNHRNCEDIAMAFLVANHTQHLPGEQAHPVYVEGKIRDRGIFGGISSGSGHLSARSQCISEITRVYRKYGWDYPLFDVSLNDRSWIRHFPGFWWQMRPSFFVEWWPTNFAEKLQLKFGL